MKDGDGAIGNADFGVEAEAAAAEILQAVQARTELVENMAAGAIGPFRVELLRGTCFGRAKMNFRQRLAFVAGHRPEIIPIEDG